MGKNACAVTLEDSHRQERHVGDVLSAHSLLPRLFFTCRFSSFAALPLHSMTLIRQTRCAFVATQIYT